MAKDSIKRKSIKAANHNASIFLSTNFNIKKYHQCALTNGYHLRSYICIFRMQHGLTNLASNQFNPSWKHKITHKPITHKMAEWKQRVVFTSAERNWGRSCRGERRAHKARWRTHFRAQSWINKDITNLVLPFMISPIALSFLAISLISLFTLKDL